MLGVLAREDEDVCAVGVTSRATDAPVTPDTLFQIGSITKVWTTTLVQILAEEGRLQLDAPVRTYVPELKLLDEGTAEAVTVRHLVNHTSGLPGDYFPDTGRGDDCLERYLGVLGSAELTHPLGALFSYSNAAFVLAGLVIERVEGTTWDSALVRRLIEPMALSGTVTLPEDALLHRCAVGHLGSGPSQRVTPRWMLPRSCGPAGLIAARAHDVLEFARLHLTGGITRSGARLLDADSVKAMQTITVSMPGDDEGRLGFGLGWGLGRWSGKSVLQHDGGTIGQAAALRVFPELGVAVCLTSNGGDWIPFRDAVLTEAVADAVGLAPPGALTPKQLPSPANSGDFVGTYRNIGAVITVTRRGEELLIALQALDLLEALATDDLSTPRPLRAHGADAFLFLAPDGSSWIQVQFIRGSAGDVAYLHTFGRAARRSVTTAGSSLEGSGEHA